MELLNIFNSGGLWIIPLICLIGGIIFLMQAYAASKSDSTTQVGGTVLDNTGNVPFYKTGQFVFAIILFLAAIGTYLWIASDYAGV